jgi:hypothetical protein
MTDFATLGMDVDSRGLVRGREELGRLARAGGDVERGMGDLQGAFGSLGDTIRRWAGPAAIGLAINKLRSLTTEAMNNIDAQAKLARAVGGTTAGLQALSRAGDRAGVQQGELAAAATRLNQRLGQVIATGSGADNTFRALGLSARQLAGMDIDSRFMAISDAMKAAGMSSQEMSFHLRELGIRQASVITLIQGGSEEIERSRKVMQDFGVAVSEIDAAQIERTNDALSEVGRVFEGLQNQMAIALAPAIERTANAFTAMAMEGGIVFNAIRAFVDQLPRLVAYLSTAVGGLTAYGAVLVTIAAAKWAVAAAANGLRFALMRLGIPLLVIAAGELVYRFTRLSDAAGGAGKAVGLIGDIFSEVFARMGQGVNLIGEMFEGMGMTITGAFQTAFGAVASAFNDYVMKPIVSGFNTLIDAANSFGASFQRIADPRLGEGISGAGQYNLDAGRAIVMSASGDLRSLLSQPLASVQAIRDLLSSMKDEGLTLPDVLGVGGEENGADGAASGGAGLVNSLEKLTELIGRVEQTDPRAAIEAWHTEAMSALADANLIERGMLDEHNAYKLQIEQLYLDQLAELRQKARDEDLQSYQSFFGSMAGALQSGGERMLGISKAFGLAEAAVSMWRGAAKALELPFPASLAAWGQVLATGARALSSIRSVRPGSSGGASAGGGSAGGVSAAGGDSAQAGASPATQTVIIDAPGMDLSSFVKMANAAHKEGHLLRFQTA